MNIRLFSVVLAAVGSLALAACTVTEGTGNSGGAGGGGGSTTTNSTSTTTSSSTTNSSSSSGGGGAPACQGCAEVITPPDGDLNMICATSSDIYNALQDCMCGMGGMGGPCEMDCQDSMMMCVAWGMLPTACIDCRTANCMNEFNACSNDVP